MAPVVVRRASSSRPSWIPVGVRGTTRSERCAAQAAADHVVRVLTPEAIAERAGIHVGLRTSALACLRALARLAPALDASPLVWGVTGGVGFALATGLAALRPDSDLDMLLRAPSAADADALRDIGRLSTSLRVRVDVQVQAPAGAFALADWLRGDGRVLLKTDRGPLLVDDPWGDPSRIETDRATAA